MAVTDIQATVLRITGVSPTANSVEDAQRFVVSSVPKNLLKWAATFTVPSNHGGNTSDGVTITMPTGTDSVLDVSRNGFSATEVPYEMKGFIANTASLHLATNTYPKYYFNDTNPGEGSKVIVKPVPTDSATAVVLYVDFSKIDDDCDLRNAVINYSSSREFSKLSSDEFPTISIKSVPPDVPVEPSISSSGVSTVAKADISGDVPTYTKPTITAKVSFNDFFESGSLNPFDDSDPSAFNVTAVSPDTPTLGSTSVTITGTAPVYTSPAITTTGSDSTSVDLTKLDTASWTDLDYDFDDENIDPLKWFQVAGDLIQNEEDIELAQAQLQKISTYIQAYSTAMQNQLNKFNDANIEFQAILQKDLKDADFDNQEDARLLQKYQAELGIYQAEVGAEVQEYTQKLQRYTSELNTAYQAWTKTESDNLQVYQMDIQNELNNFNKENARYQANVQASISKFQVDAAEAQKEGDLTLQADIQDYSQELALFNGEIQIYQAEVQSEVAEYQNKLGKQKSYSQEADLYYKWAQSEISLYIQNNSKMIALSMASQSQQQSQQKAG